MYYHIFSSPLGSITAVFSDDVLTGLYFEDQKYFPLLSGVKEKDGSKGITELKIWLTEYFNGRSPDFTPEIKLFGSEFRLMIWETLKDIPYGKTVSYGELAKMAEAKYKRKFFPRATGGAVGHNPISLIVPCHRVVGSDGSLTGYAGGTERKRFLLELEKGKL